MLDSQLTPGGWDGEIEIGGRPLPEYELVRCLGRGGFGEVWEAKVSPSGVLHALKFVRLGRAGSEVEQGALEIYKKVSHSNLINLINYWILEDYLVIAMELGKKSLEDVFREEKERDKNSEGIPIKDLLGYMSDAAAGLDCLNEPNHLDVGEVRFGMQHRDIKPLNLLIFGDSVKSVKVADIGLLKLMSGDFADHSNGAFTPAFAAPEFHRLETTRWSDQYSLAATYCYLRCGRTPYGKNLFHIVDKQNRKEPPDLEGLTEPERPVVARALSLDPVRRYPSCMDFVEALKLALKPTKPEFVFPKEKKDFEFGVGNTRPFTLGLRRNGFQGEMSLSFTNLPPGVSIGAARVPETGDKATVEVRVGEGASKGKQTIRAIGSRIASGNSGTSATARLVEVDIGIEVVDSADTFASKGHDAYTQDENQDAVRHLSQAVHLDPDSKKNRIQLGNAYVNLGNYEAAAREYYEVIGDPQYKSDVQSKLEMIRKQAEQGRRSNGHDPQ